MICRFRSKDAEEIGEQLTPTERGDEMTTDAMGLWVAVAKIEIGKGASRGSIISLLVGMKLSTEDATNLVDAIVTN